MFLHKGWKTMTTHQRMADMMNQRCKCHAGYKHAKCEGGLARGTAYYTPEFAKRVVKALLQELSKNGLQQEINGRKTLLSKFGEGTACVCVTPCASMRVPCNAEIGNRDCKDHSNGTQHEQAPFSDEAQQPRQHKPETGQTDMDRGTCEHACGVQQLKSETDVDEIKRKLYLLHAATGHTNTRNLVTALQKRGANELIIKLAKEFRCSLCEERRKIGSKHVSSLAPLPPKLATICADGGKWIHPVTQEHYEFCLVIDEGSRYRVAKIMKQGKHQTMNAEQIMDYLRDGWFQFFGVPNVLRLDPAGAFRSREIEKMCDDYEIYLDLIPGEAHWQIGSCEEAIKGTKEVLTKLAEQDPEREPQELLSVAVKTFNEREMVRGFSPCQHVLGRAPDETGRFIHPETTNGIDLMVPNPGEECIEGIQLRKRAEQALSEWQANQRVTRGLQSRAKPRHNYHAGDLVYFWRKQVSGKNPGKNGMFLGPARVLATEKKRDSEGNLAPSSAVWLVRGRRLIKCCPEQLRRASEREELLEFLGSPESHQETWDFSRVASALGGNELDDISNDVPDLATWQRDYDVTMGIAPTVRHRGKRPVDQTQGNPQRDPFCEKSRGTKSRRESGEDSGMVNERVEEAWWTQIPEEVFGEGKGEHFWNEPKASVEISICMPETKRGMTRAVEDLGGYFVNQLKRRAVEVSEKRLTPKELEQFREAKHKEVTNYIAAQAFEAVPPELRPSKEQAIGMRWILTWKQNDDGSYKAKARAILKGYQDPQYEYRATTTPVMTRQTRQLLLQVAAWKRWGVKKGDVSGAFLQGRQYPNELYCVPCPEILKAMGLGPEEIVKVKKGCYGLVDAPLEWYLTVSEYLKEEGLVKSWSDPCCWLWKPKGVLRGIIAGHVDDFLFCGNPKDPEWLALEKRIQTRFKWGEWEEGNFTQCGVKIER